MNISKESPSILPLHNAKFGLELLGLYRERSSEENPNSTQLALMARHPSGRFWWTHSLDRNSSRAQTRSIV